MSKCSPKSRPVLLLSRSKAHFTGKIYIETVLYAYIKEHFDIKLIFEKTLIKLRTNFYTSVLKTKIIYTIIIAIIFTSSFL